MINRLSHKSLQHCSCFPAQHKNTKAQMCPVEELASLLLESLTSASMPDTASNIVSASMALLLHEFSCI